MPGISEITELNRIEDFIALAKEGERVNVSVELRKQNVSQKVHPEETEEMKTEISMYLLFGDYTFTVGENVKKISKSYMVGSTEESLSDARVDKNIANERLKMDYKRLMDAKIVLEEKFF